MGSLSARQNRRYSIRNSVICLKSGRTGRTGRTGSYKKFIHTTMIISNVEFALIDDWSEFWVYNDDIFNNDNYC